MILSPLFPYRRSRSGSKIGCSNADIDISGGGEWTTWQEWYGDLSQLFHCFVHVPIFDFCQKRTKSKLLEIDYQKAKEMFYEEDKEFWDREMEI